MRPNNFDLIRLFAAFQVVIYHGLEHLRLREAVDNISPIIVEIIGVFPGVPIFFAISGFLISRSLERDTNLKQYITNRILRIYPALYVCFFVSVAAVAWFSPTIFQNASLLSVATWSVAQLSIAQFYNPDFLRGFGVGVLNGSLWTITVELQFYVALPILYSLLQLRTHKRNFSLIAITFIFLVVGRAIHHTSDTWSIAILRKFAYVSMFPYFWMFLVGVLFQRNWIVLQPWLEDKFHLWFGLYCSSALFFHALGYQVGSNHQVPIMSILLAATTLSAAFTKRKLSELLLRGNDISYGIYIYHMVIINVLLTCFPKPAFGSLVLLVVLNTSAASLSWRFIESRFLKLKPRLQTASNKIGLDCS